VRISFVRIIAAGEEQTGSTYEFARRAQRHARRVSAIEAILVEVVECVRFTGNVYGCNIVTLTRRPLNEHPLGVLCNAKTRHRLGNEG